MYQREAVRVWRMRAIVGQVGGGEGSVGTDFQRDLHIFEDLLHIGLEKEDHHGGEVIG